MAICPERCRTYLVLEYLIWTCLSLRTCLCGSGSRFRSARSSSMPQIMSISACPTPPLCPVRTARTAVPPSEQLLRRPRPESFNWGLRFSFDTRQFRGGEKGTRDRHWPFDLHGSDRIRKIIEIRPDSMRTVQQPESSPVSGKALSVANTWNETNQTEVYRSDR